MHASAQPSFRGSGCNKIASSAVRPQPQERGLAVEIPICMVSRLNRPNCRGFARERRRQATQGTQANRQKYVSWNPKRMKSSASHAVTSLSRHIAAKATMSIVPVVGNAAARGFAKNTNATDAWFIYTSDRDARAFSGTGQIFSVAYQRGSARFIG